MKRHCKKTGNGPSCDGPVPEVDTRAWTPERPRPTPAYFSAQTLDWVESGPVCTGTAEAASGTMSAGFSFCT